MSPVSFWLVIAGLFAVLLTFVSLIVYAGVAEYGRSFIVINVLVWGTPWAVGILAMCVSRFRRRKPVSLAAPPTRSAG